MYSTAGIRHKFAVTRGGWPAELTVSGSKVLVLSDAVVINVY